MKNLYILLLLSLSFGTVTDIDGNVYETVQIGDQLWMAENLKVTHYNNGEEIPNITNNGDWGGLSTGAYGDYDNNPTNSETYGRLYNWFAVDDDRGVCPDGWHIPTDEEYTVLTDYLGGENVAGGKMKEEGLDHWDSPNAGATNESGFTALPAGYRYSSNGYYYNMGNYGDFWSSSESSSGSAWFRLLYYNYSNVNRFSYSKQDGFSVRCLADETAGCTDPEACNYDETATDDDGSCEYDYDCAGECGGDLEPDCCGVCGGDNSQCSNCCGMPFPDDCSGMCCSEVCYNDYCGVCDDIPENDCVQDCAGVWGGELEWDCAGICGGDNSSYDGCCGLPPNDDCTDDCYIDSLGACCIEEDADECGLCFGDGTSCCEDGETNNDNPCNPWECWGDEWYEIIIDCAEQEGVTCEGGVYVPPEEGECCSECVLYGDLNGDGTINVIDIVMAVDLILNDNYDVVGDANEDGQLNVIDIVILVDWVLNGMPEADSDGDGVIDEDDSDPNNPYQCSDLDGDTCDDCSTGTFNPSDDGYDYDGDGQCDDGDCDDDNDGCQECWDYCP